MADSLDDILREENALAKNRALKRIEAEISKTEREKLVEKFNAEIEGISTRLSAYYRIPSRYRPEIKTLEKELDLKLAALRSLGVETETSRRHF